MIKIKVYPGLLCKADALDEDGFILVEEGTTVGDLLKRIGYPVVLARGGLYMLNYQQTGTNTKLTDGDTLSIIAPLAGG